MSNIEPTEDISINRDQSTRETHPVQDRLQHSVTYRSHRKQKHGVAFIPAVDFPDETSHKYFHPRRSGLVCDAPLGLKY